MTMARAVAAMPMREMSKGVETCLEKLGFVAMLSIFLASSVGVSSRSIELVSGLLACDFFGGFLCCFGCACVW